MGGVTWVDDIVKICANGSAELCEWSKAAGKTNQAIPAKVYDHLAQNSKVNRFEEYVVNWTSAELLK